MIIRTRVCAHIFGLFKKHSPSIFTSYFSIQRLSPTQLKQIAHVLQQRSQETSISNERIVYRSVMDKDK